jgi:pyrimidine oxygenase
MDLGIFIPIGNNGWIMSANSPQYRPSFTLNRTIAEKAEAYDFNFLLSMVKLRGFGGLTEFWDHNLESFTLMAGLAAVTEHIQLFASVALPTLPPALVARMASTIDDILSGTTSAIITEMQNAFALNIGTVIGSHATVARQFDELASIDGLKGVMCIFDDFVTGTEDFGRHVMPLLHCR